MSQRGIRFVVLPDMFLVHVPVSNASALMAGVTNEGHIVRPWMPHHGAHYDQFKADWTGDRTEYPPSSLFEPANPPVDMTAQQ